MNHSFAMVAKPSCSHKAITYLVVQVLIVLLNIIAVVILSKLKGYKGNTNHCVVRLLVLSDAVGAITTLTPISMSCLGYKFVESNACQVFGFLSNVILLWTVFIVLTMCTMRYFAVVKPLFYRTYITFSLIRWLLLGLLIWSFAHIMLPLFGVGRFKFYPVGQYCSFEIPPKRRRDFALVHLIVWEGWLFIFVVVCLTVRMVQELRIKRKLTSRLSFQQRRGIQANRIRQRGYTMMTVVIVTIFLVCYIPFLAYRTLTLVKKDVDESYHFHLHLLAHINPMLNPVLYVSFNRGYRSAVRSMFAKVFNCFAEPVRKVSTTNSICMSLFSEDGTVPKHSTARNSTSAFLEVPSIREKGNQANTSVEEKTVKRRKGKRNSIDVSAIGSPVQGLNGVKADILSPGRSKTRIEEISEATGHLSTNRTICHTDASPMHSSFTTPFHTNQALEQISETKPRGLSVSSILYAVDNIVVQRSSSNFPSVVIVNGDCDDYEAIGDVKSKKDDDCNDDGNDDVFRP